MVVMAARAMRGSNTSLIIGTYLLVLLTSTLADPCAPFGNPLTTGRNCPSSTYPTIYGSDGTRFAATATIAYCATADNYLYSETRYPLDGATTPVVGDQFEYTLWWDQPDTHCVLDIVSYVGSNYLRNSGNVDANGFINHPRVDISQYAYRKWYTRRFTLPDYVNNPIAITVGCDTPGTSIGDKKIFFKGVKLLDSAGNVKKVLADETQQCVGVTGCAPTCTNGVCDLDQTCKCTPGWTDTVCSTAVCLTGCVNGGCTAPDQCNCQNGWQGTLCDTAICAANCNIFGGHCTVPGTCVCRQGYSDVNCNTYCSGTAPFAGVECQTINGTSVWVYNNTLVISTSTVQVNVIVIGDLVVQSNLTLTDGAVITVTGCPVLNGSLVLQLSAEEIEVLLETGLLDRTVLLYNSACSVSDFTSVEISNQNELQCVRVQQTPKQSPGQFSVLVTATRTDCKSDAPTTTTAPPSLPDWAIAIIVVVPVVASGIGLAVGLVRRQRQYDKEMARLEGK